MKHSITKSHLFILFAILSLFFFVMVVAAQDDTSSSEEDLIERGHYLAEIGQCIDCHTPPRDEFADPTALDFDQVVTFSMYTVDALDTDEKLLAGGRPFDLGPMGVLFTPNITPDEATGIGSWTDEELETTIRLGIRPDGQILHPLMAVNTYGKWSAEDMEAMIAYLRSIPAVENEVPRDTIFRDMFDGDPVEALAELEIAETQPEDPIERGQYLVDNVMRCTDCHTPLDPETGIPDFSSYLAGGFPYEGPWGIIYSANITPHATAGIGAWSDQQIERVLREGVGIDNRRLILMPWQGYSAVTDEDLQVVLAYLRSIEPIDNEVPAPSISEDLIILEEPES